MSDENTYILTTDGDVKFTHESVEALMDLMTRDHTVGAVCARTHPLGIGPIVWYQTFDYAIGHWFQKVLHVHAYLCGNISRCWFSIKRMFKTYYARLLVQLIIQLSGLKAFTSEGYVVLKYNDNAVTLIPQALS